MIREEKPQKTSKNLENIEKTSTSLEKPRKPSKTFKKPQKTQKPQFSNLEKSVDSASTRINLFAFRTYESKELN